MFQYLPRYSDEAVTQRINNLFGRLLGAPLVQTFATSLDAGAFEKNGRSVRFLNFIKSVRRRVFLAQTRGNWTDLETFLLEAATIGLSVASGTAETLPPVDLSC